MYTFIHKRNEPYLPLLSSRRASPVLIFRAVEDRRLSWLGWLVTYRSGLPGHECQY